MSGPGIPIAAAAGPRYWAALRWIMGEALRGRTGAVARLALWSLLEAAPAYVSGRVIAEALDGGFLAGRTATGLGWLGLLAGTVVVAGWATRRVVACLADIVEPVRDRLVRRVVGAALRRTTGPPHEAELAGVARLTQQTEIVREALAGILSTLRGFLFSTVGVVAGLASLRPSFMLLVLPPLVVALVGLALIVRAQVAVQREQVLAEERVADMASRVATGLRDVTACGAEDEAHALIGTHVDAQARAAGRSARLKALSSLVVGVGGWLPFALLLAAIPALLRGGVTPGVIAGAVTYLAHALLPALERLVEAVSGVGAWLVTAADRIRDVTADDPSAPRGPAAPHPGPDGLPGPDGNELRLHGVTFRYGPHSDPVLRDFDLVIPDRDHIAVAGPSGVGKSTLAGLLAGTLRPNAGTVSLGGTPLSDLDPGVLVDRRVVIPQEAYVFAGTLADNLAYHRPDADRRQLDAAVAAVGLTDLVARLGGYDATLDPEALSAGERQLVALARAYLSPAPIALLDEATCHLDPRAEARVELAFAGRPGTLVVVAHRISSALRARRVLVLDGRQVHLGDHETLLGSSPLYRELVGTWEQPGQPPDAQPRRSEPAELPSDPDGVDAVARLGLGDRR